MNLILLRVDVNPRVALCVFVSILIILTGEFCQLRPAYAYTPTPTITSFTPSVGWAGPEKNPEGGTLVKIEGDFFDPVLENNKVSFTDSLGSQTVEAKKLLNPKGKYQVEDVIGSPGSALGQLLNPWDVVVDSSNMYNMYGSGDVYVVDRGNKRIQVFGSDGTPHKQFGAGYLVDPWGIALDKDKNVYVSDSGTPSNGIVKFDKDGKFSRNIGKDVLKLPTSIAVDEYGSVYVIDTGPGQDADAFIKFDSSGTLVFSRTGPSMYPFHVITGLTLNYPSGPIYITDWERRAIHQYTIDGAYVSTWGDEGNPNLDPNSEKTFLKKWGMPEFTRPGRVVVEEPSFTIDEKEFLYVPAELYYGSFGYFSTVMKLDSSGNLLTKVEVDPAINALGFCTMDGDKRIYTVNPDPKHCIKVLALPQSEDELLVYVPYGAKTGPIKIMRVSQNEQPSSTSTDSFTVLEKLDTIDVTKVEATQGLQSYPFITGKETLVWAQINGVFGHPTLDKATVKIVTPEGKSSVYPTDHLKPEGMQTIIHFHIPTNLIENPGKYKFEVNIERDGKPLQHSPWAEDIEFKDAKRVELLFVMLTGVPNDKWGSQDPFPWFDMKKFLYGIETFRRVYPLSDVDYHLVSKYSELLSDGFLADAEREPLVREIISMKNEFSKTNPSFDGVDRTIGIMDTKLGKGIDIGYTMLDTPVTLFSTPVWGENVSHEIGHSYGLVPEGNSNFVHDEGGDHSKNKFLTEEHGAPITAWNPITDEMLPGSKATSIMFSHATDADYDDAYFFESTDKDGKNLDYQHLLNQINPEISKKSNPSSASSMLNSMSQLNTQKFVLLGSIETGGNVYIEQSFLTTSGIPITPLQESDYSLAFLDESNQILSRDNFSVSFSGQDMGSTETGLFNLVRPYPDGTTKVEIRFKDAILETLIPSKNSPVVNSVTVNYDSPLLVVHWEATDPDGDQLTYSVYYSADGGVTFMPVATGLKQTSFVLDHSTIPGSANAIIRVEANDGFHVAGSTSGSFQLQEKNPQPEILVPSNEATFTEGGSIVLRGAAFDPEDGILSGSNLRWELDDSIDLGSGENLRIQDMPANLFAGPVLMPLEIGPHTITLIATDSDNNHATKKIQIEIVADTDRDGYGDELEKKLGTDPYDPSDVPVGSISGMKFDDLNGNGKKDSGEPGLSGWTIVLKKPDGKTQNTGTDSSGSYVFDDLLIGNYAVGEVTKPGYIQTSPSISESGSATFTIDVLAGSRIVGKDFGNFKLGEVHGVKWEDLNANGNKDSYEKGLEGWEINLKGTDSIMGREVNIKTTTEADGSYSFENLTAGTYVISEKVKDDWVQTTPATGSYTVSITSGADITEQDFGNFKKGNVTGGGYIPARNGKKATFGLSGAYPGNGGTANGSLEYQDPTSKLNIKSVKIITVATTVDKRIGVITGLARVNGAGSYPFEVYVEDNGEPGKGVDVFKIYLPTYPYSKGAILGSGNIQIHS